MKHLLKFIGVWVAILVAGWFIFTCPVWIPLSILVGAVVISASRLLWLLTK